MNVMLRREVENRLRLLRRYLKIKAVLAYLDEPELKIFWTRFIYRIYRINQTNLVNPVQIYCSLCRNLTSKGTKFR